MHNDLKKINTHTTSGLYCVIVGEVSGINRLQKECCSVDNAIRPLNIMLLQRRNDPSELFAQVELGQRFKSSTRLSI